MLGGVYYRYMTNPTPLTLTINPTTTATIHDTSLAATPWRS